MSFKIFCDRILRKEPPRIYAIVPGKKAVAESEWNHHDWFLTLSLLRLLNDKTII